MLPTNVLGMLSSNPTATGKSGGNVTNVQMAIRTPGLLLSATEAMVQAARSAQGDLCANTTLCVPRRLWDGHGLESRAYLLKVSPVVHLCVPTVHGNLNRTCYRLSVIVVFLQHVTQRLILISKMLAMNVTWQMHS